MDDPLLAQDSPIGRVRCYMNSLQGRIACFMSLKLTLTIKNQALPGEHNQQQPWWKHKIWANARSKHFVKNNINIKFVFGLCIEMKV